MATETPAQRRTRLIEQYLIHNYQPYWVQELPRQTLNKAIEFADCIIAATPQEPLPKHSKAQITLLKELIRDMLRDMANGDCSLFLAHDSRFEEICDGLAPDPQEPEPTRYPSEIQTRLIILVEYCLAASDPLDRSFVLKTLAAIKRDLGIA